MTGVAGPAAYPSRPAERDAWIVGRRGPRHVVRPDRPHAFFVEDEVDDAGVARRVATIFLVNRECPFRCLMCDLWRDTLEERVPSGAIAAQVGAALSELPEAEVIKLYNSGSFFDPRAIPPGDYAEIAARLSRFQRVIVESHPAFVGPEVERFRDLLRGRLEVAIGLETAHPAVLERLNKRMTLESFARAAGQLGEMKVAMRSFLLVQPPFLPADEAIGWAVRSASFAFDHGAVAVSLIPVRGGNGALDALAASGDFSPPRLRTLEEALDGALALGRGRVFADTWDLAHFSSCPDCLDRRATRLRDVNLSQRPLDRVNCAACGGR